MRPFETRLIAFQGLIADPQLNMQYHYARNNPLKFIDVNGRESADAAYANGREESVVLNSLASTAPPDPTQREAANAAKAGTGVPVGPPDYVAQRYRALTLVSITFGYAPGSSDYIAQGFRTPSTITITTTTVTFTTWGTRTSIASTTYAIRISTTSMFQQNPARTTLNSPVINWPGRQYMGIGVEYWELAVVGAIALEFAYGQEWAVFETATLGIDIYQSATLPYQFDQGPYIIGIGYAQPH